MDGSGVTIRKINTMSRVVENIIYSDVRGCVSICNDRSRCRRRSHWGIPLTVVVAFAFVFAIAGCSTVRPDRSPISPESSESSGIEKSAGKKLPVSARLAGVFGRKPRPAEEPWRPDESLVKAVREGRVLSESPFAEIAAQTGRELLDPSRRGAAEGNQIAVFDQGFDALVMRMHLIRSAKHSIVWQTFVWSDDAVGRMLTKELTAAALRGVKVRVIVDHLGAKGQVSVIARAAVENPNLSVKLYRPVGSRIELRMLAVVGQALSQFRELNQRMHTKLLVVDGVVGVTGGRNTGDDYFSQSLANNFRDREVLVTGPVVASMMQSFEQFWSYRYCVDTEEMKDIRKLITDAFRLTKKPQHGDERPRVQETFDELNRLAGDSAFIRDNFLSRLRSVERAEYIGDDPGKNETSNLRGGGRLTQKLRSLFQDAKDEILVQSPYFVLDRWDQAFIKRIRRNNPDINIVISTNSYDCTDKLIAYASNLRLRRMYCEDLGMRVYEFKADPLERSEVLPRYERLERYYRESIEDTRHDRGRPPWLAIHAKTIVVDERHTFIGSFNLDPRSANLNTEAGLLIDDASLASDVAALIHRDIHPENSWVVNLKRRVPGADEVNGMIDRVSEVLPIEFWPVIGTACFELKPGAEETALDDPLFYQNYRSVGSLPGGEFRGHWGKIQVRFLKGFGRFLTPLL